MAGLKDKSISMERQLWRKHLKFRGLLDGPERPQELFTKVNFWLASILEWDEDATQLAVRAYQRGATLNQHQQTPRDVVVEFAEDTLKFQILEIAQSKEHLQYEEEKNPVFSRPTSSSYTNQVCFETSDLSSMRSKSKIPLDADGET